MFGLSFVCAYALKTVLPFQLLAMPGEVIVAVYMYLDPRSIFSLATAHQHFGRFVDDKQIWARVQMHDNWCFENNTFLAMIQFCPKIEQISFKHTGFARAQPQPVPSMAQGILGRMTNLCFLSVRSPAFTHGFFLQLLLHLHTLLLLDCPNLDVDTIVEALQRMRQSKSLRRLDLSGVQSVSSFNKWQICSLCPNLQQARSNAVMGDYIAEQCFLDCPLLTHFDCWPLGLTKENWANLVHHYPRVMFGECIKATL